jgi:hypothetical protein
VGKGGGDGGVHGFGAAGQDREQPVTVPGDTDERRRFDRDVLVVG